MLLKGENQSTFLEGPFCFWFGNLTFMSRINSMFSSVVHVKSKKKKNKRRAWSVFEAFGMLTWT